MVADMDVDRADWSSFAMQVGERGMLMTALAWLRQLWMSFLSRNSTARAPRFDLRPGIALDLRTGYDFSKEADRLRACECLREEKPFLLVASSRCMSSSQLQSSARDSKRCRAMASDGLRHLTFMFELCKDQIDGKRFLLHEHPAQARSWDLWMFHEILEMLGVAKSHGQSMHPRIVVH